MFAKLKKKIAEEAAIGPRPGGAARIPRSVSKESITSVGADSGDDFASDGSSSREDLSSQLLRRNEQIRKLEAKLSDYAEQVRNLQKIKEKLEIALEKHQDSSMKKFQEQNEAYQANRAKMAEGMALALEKKDQEWREKLVHLEKEKEMLSAQLQEMREQSLNLFQKRDEIDELEGFQQQELAKVKHMEESLSRAEQELEACRRELTHAKQELQVTSNLSSLLSNEVEELRQQHSELEAQRDELVAAEVNAENKITALEQRGQELQTFIQHLSADLQNARVAASGCEKRLETLQIEHESLKLEYEQHKLKMTVEVVEKNKLIEHLQEKVSSLEKRLEGNFSGDEHVWELLKEKTALEQKLDDTRQQLLTARTNHAETVNLLETQVTKLNSKVTEAQGLLCERDEFLKNFKESNMCQLKELDQALQLANRALERSKEEIGERDLQIQKLQTDLEVESSKLQQHISTVKHQCAERISRLEAQIAALETAREFDKTTSQHKISQLEQENEDFNESRQEYESSLKKQESELERLKKELSSRETVSVEIAKALEETRKQREELQQQVTDLILLIKEKDQLINEKTDVILKKEEELNQLSQGHEALVLQTHLLQSDIEACKSQAAEREETAGKQISALRLKMQEQLLASERNVLALEAARAFNKHLYPPEDSEVEQNGEMAAADILQLQKDNRDLEQQISEKNKMIKQLQQRMAELKKTLQKELKIRPDNEIPEVREKPNSEVPNAAMTVTNNSDLNDSREINFEYLKHVVLKFMSCREAEAFHLIKAVSVLLNFSQEEENMLKETLEYKMSWFGSKPSPKGSIRPSISNPRTAWS
ncbi:golgin subfamily A member 1 isoform X2 [Malaclemys terrapin pileata]|uniref:golgin subfamily A member 1 isoform X2 n=1 Tax=Malaclemys terrapin pileata TaxID=2991368 RepID=UPI0023A7C134|nr:golgin subfamily A member 1 isoform X2 [Malaclemys terrapin pileata]